MAEQQGRQAETEDGFTPITSQDEFDRMVKDRIERAKRSATPADYDELRKKAEELDDAVRRADEAEAERDKLRHAAEAEAERDKLRHAAEVDAWKAEASASMGIPAAVLRGETKEDILAHAEAIRSAMPVYPQVKEWGGDAARPMDRQEILAIKNPRERKAAILANLDQF